MSSVPPEAASPSWCCSRAGARRRYFPRELGAVPSVEAPSGQAEQEIRRTRGNSRESEREARTVWRRGSDALGPRPARREQSEAERGRGQEEVTDRAPALRIYRKYQHVM